MSALWQTFPSSKSRGQHIRNQHAAEASEERDTQSRQQCPRFWSPQEHSLFLDALAKYGTSSNFTIAKYIGTKTAKQVGTHKRIFLRDNPTWMSEIRRETTTNCRSEPIPTRSDTDETESVEIEPDPIHSPNNQHTPTPSTITPVESLLDMSDVAQSEMGTKSIADHMIPTTEHVSYNRNSAATPLTNASTVTHTQYGEAGPQDRRKQLADKRKSLMLDFLRDATLLTNRLLDDDEWSQLESLIDQLTHNLKTLVDSRPRRHPTTNWKKRQNRRRRQDDRSQSWLSENQRPQSQCQKDTPSQEAITSKHVQPQRPSQP